MNAQILIADDHSMIREALTIRLNQLGFHVVGEAATGDEIIELSSAQASDLILMDISMPGRNGLEAAREIKKANPQRKILMLSTYDRQDYVQAVQALGADGYLLKSADLDELKRAIDVVLMGGLYFSEPVKEIMARGNEPEDHADLTSRERQILMLVDQGLRSKEIGTKLNISTRTVEVHRRNLKRKLAR